MRRTAYSASAAFLVCILFALSGAASAQQFTQYTYDALGRVISAIDANGKKVAYTYDSAGNRTRVSNGAEFTEIVPTAWSASSTAAGVTGLTATNGLRDGAYAATNTIQVTNVEAGPWIMADLGSAQNVNHIDVIPAIESSTGATLADLNDTAVEYSLDGTTWISAAAIEGVSPGASKTVVLGGVSLRYLRLHRLATGRIALGDLRLYSAASANTPLIANPDSITTSGSAITFDPRANDQDLDGYSIAISGVDMPPHGTAVVNAGVSITYTPTPGYFGADSFAYTVTDGHNGSASAVVSVTVQSATNHPPVAVNDQFNIGDRGTTAVDGISNLRPLVNDYDPDGDVITITGTSTPAHGTATVVGSGVVQYQPVVGFDGSDTFTYSISDGRGGTAGATITVTAANSNPVAVQDNISTAQGQAVTFDPRLNDSDPNGDAISITSINQPTNGSAVLNANQTVTYTPYATFYGGDNLTYQLSDGRGGTATGLVSILVAQAPPPNAVSDSLPASAGVPVTFDPRTNDSDPQNRPLTVVAVTAPSHGTAAANSSGTAITYTSTAGYSGADSFSYTISNDLGVTATAVVAINSEAVEYLVVGGGGAGGQTFSTAGAGGGGGGGLLQGAIALVPGAQTITVGAGGTNSSLAGSSSIGSLVVASGGGAGGWGWNSGHGAGGNGGSGGGAGGLTGSGGAPVSGQGFKGGDSTTYGASGGGGGAGGLGQPSIGATAGKGGPGFVSSISGSPVSYAAGGGGGIVSGGAMANAGAGGDGSSSGGGGTSSSDPQDGALARGGGGGGAGGTQVVGLGGSGIVILRYRGAPKATGGTITQVGGYTIHTFGASGSFSLTSTNVPPVAVNDSITTPSGLPIVFDPRANDSDANGDPLTIISLTAPTHGVAVFTGRSIPVQYTPTLGWSGNDSFTYTISDGQGGVATATVNVTVTGGAQVDYLVVGGGGGGGAWIGGGGGGGQVKAGTMLLASGSYAVSVGAGGAGGPYDPDDGIITAGSDGTASSLGTVVISQPGGGGAVRSAAAPTTGADGGGGGGTGSTGNKAGGPGAYNGNPGGSGSGAGGGGGGAAVAGSSGPAYGGAGSGQGGGGVSSSITGTATAYGGGGGGGGYGDGSGSAAAGPPGDSSAGGGGGTSFGTNKDGAAAPAHRGGGGGGGSESAGDGRGSGGAGGSGIVVIRYPTGSISATGGTITTAGGYTIHTFTSNGTFTVP